MLTPKQSRFVETYLVDLNATQAAIRAGYSKRTAQVQGARLMTNPEIVAAIEAGKLARSERTKIEADWVLTRLVAEAMADLADLFDDDNKLKSVAEWPPIWRQGLVAGVEVEALFEGVGDKRVQIGVVKRLKFSDRVKRLEMIGKHVAVQAFQEQVKIGGIEGLADRLSRAEERSDATCDGTHSPVKKGTR